MDPLDDVSAVIEHPPDVLGVDSARKMGVAVVGTVLLAFSLTGLLGNLEEIVPDEVLGPSELAVGAVGDLGWYSVRIMLELMLVLPSQVRATHHRLHHGIPIHTTAELDFPGTDGGRHAFLHCSFVHPLRQWVEICGSAGTMRMDDFVIGSPTEACLQLETESRLTEKDLVHERRTERIVTRDCIQEVEMIRNFSEIARGATPLLVMQGDSEVHRIVNESRGAGTLVAAVSRR